MRLPFVTRKSFEELDEAYGTIVRYSLQLEETVTKQRCEIARCHRALSAKPAKKARGYVFMRPGWKEMIQ